MKFRRLLVAIVCALVALGCQSEEYFVASRTASIEEFHLETGAPASIAIDMPIYAGAMFLGVLVLSWLALRLAQLPILENLNTIRLFLVVPFPMAVLGLIPVIGLYAIYGAALISIVAWFTKPRSAQKPSKLSNPSQNLGAQ